MSLLSGKSAIVTGSTSGIGLGIAEQLAQAGCRVLLSGFGDAALIEAIRSRLAEHYHVDVHFHGADLTRPQEVQELVRFAEDLFGGVDILVNNAGVQHAAPITEFPVDRWDYVLALNLSAVFHGMRTVLPGMLRRDWGERAPWPTRPTADEVDLTHMSRKVKEVIRAAGLRDELTFTSFRHGGFTEGADADLSDAEMRAAGRHKSAKVLPTYAKRTMKQVEAGAKKRRAMRTQEREE